MVYRCRSKTDCDTFSCTSRQLRYSFITLHDISSHYTSVFFQCLLIAIGLSDYFGFCFYDIQLKTASDKWDQSIVVSNFLGPLNPTFEH